MKRSGRVGLASAAIAMAAMGFGVATARPSQKYEPDDFADRHGDVLKALEDTKDRNAERDEYERKKILAAQVKRARKNAKRAAALHR